MKDKLDPLAAQLLEPFEELLGECIATQQSMFKGTMTAIFVTPQRLIIQDLTRKFEPKGDPNSLKPEEITDVKAAGGGGGWWEASAAILDAVSTELKIETADGRKFKLLMMDGNGPLMGSLAGGDVQTQGYRAIGEWFARHSAPSWK